mmetsp:Transcript_18920/g.47250  ORF Transcript_18920/g.47250 Transcript_18920/m.47250 type:complete len:348 (+) Transcript_18920:1415-2458(+)
MRRSRASSSAPSVTWWRSGSISSLTLASEVNNGSTCSVNLRRAQICEARECMMPGGSTPKSPTSSMYSTKKLTASCCSVGIAAGRGGRGVATSLDGVHSHRGCTVPPAAIAASRSAFACSRWLTKRMAVLHGPHHPSPRSSAVSPCPPIRKPAIRGSRAGAAGAGAADFSESGSASRCCIASSAASHESFACLFFRLHLFDDSAASASMSPRLGPASGELSASFCRFLFDLPVEPTSCAPPVAASSSSGNANAPDGCVIGRLRPAFSLRTHVELDASPPAFAEERDLFSPSAGVLAPASCCSPSLPAAAAFFFLPAGGSGCGACVISSGAARSSAASAHRPPCCPLH